MMSDFAKHQMSGAMAGMVGTAPADQLLYVLLQRQGEINGSIANLAARLGNLSDRLFGPVPMPANAPMTGAHSNAVDREPPVMDALDRAQYRAGEELEALQRHVDRLERL